MDNKYLENSKILKALSDANRLMIIDMLSDEEICACKILECMHITQPTLSHHMKILCSAGLVISRRDGKWMQYRLNNEVFSTFKPLLDEIMSKTQSTICW